MASELTKRVAVSAVGIPLALLIIYFGGWALTILIAVIAAMGTLEFYRLAQHRGVRAFHVGRQVRPGGSVKAYVDAGYVRSWRTLVDDAMARI